MFRFADPQALYLLILIPILAGIYIYMLYWKKKQLSKFGNPTLLKQMTLGYSKYRPLVKFVFLEIILTLLIFMLARPQMGMKQVEDDKMGIEVALMIDVSNSMYAQDVQPNRMERTKFFLSTLVDALHNDKISLGIFAGEAYPQIPITNDHVSVKMFTETLTPGIVTSQGTNLAAAIEFVTRSFSADEEVGKAIVIVTDGEDHEMGVEEVAENARKSGINVHVVGVGTTQGSTIPMPNGRNLLDENNREVVTSLNEDVCKKIADIGGGQFYRLDATNNAQKHLLEELKKLKATKGKSKFSEPNEQFLPLAIVIMILLIVEFFIFEAKNPLLGKLKKLKK